MLRKRRLRLTDTVICESSPFCSIQLAPFKGLGPAVATSKISVKIQYFQMNNYCSETTVSIIQVIDTSVTHNG